MRKKEEEEDRDEEKRMEVKEVAGKKEKMEDTKGERR